MSLHAFFKSENAQNNPARLLSAKRRCTIAGVPIDCLSMDEAATAVGDALQQRSGEPPFLIMGPNAQLTTLAQKNPLFAEVLRASSLNIPDGISIVLASKILGGTISSRVPGGELMERLCCEAANRNLRIFLLGGLPGAAREAAIQLQRRYPRLVIAGTYCPPLGFESNPVESDHIRRLVAESSPDLLFVALGVPKQEIWMHQNCSTLPIGAAMAVGAAFDTLAGLRSRAPLWTQKLCMEWLYRLVQEPRRLWRRYLIGNTHFIYLVLKQFLVGSRQAEKLPPDISQEPRIAFPPLHSGHSSWKTGPQI